MTISAQPPKIKYLTNKDLLREIHLSKNTYCSFTSPDYSEYDLILPNISKINVRTIAEAKRNQASRLSKRAHELAVLTGGKKLPAKEFEVDYKTIKKVDVVFRIMTFEHIPLAPVIIRKQRRFLYHMVDFGLAQPRRGRNRNMLFTVGGLVTRTGIDDAVGINIKGDFDLGGTTGCRWDPIEHKCPQRFVVARFGPLALEHMNLDGVLIVRCRRKNLAFVGG